MKRNITKVRIAALSFLIAIFGFGFICLLKIVASKPEHLVWVGILWGSFFLIFQLLLCYKVKRLWIRLIPLGTVIACYVPCLVLLSGWFAEAKHWGKLLQAAVSTLALTVILAGVSLAWSVFLLHKLLCRIKAKQFRINEGEHK